MLMLILVILLINDFIPGEMERNSEETNSSRGTQDSEFRKSGRFVGTVRYGTVRHGIVRLISSQYSMVQ